jgi:hypothetical protein
LSRWKPEELTDVMGCVLGYVTYPERWMLVDRALLRDCLSLKRDYSQGNIFGCAHSRTVNNLIKVDFPAPLGPMMPTRLKEEMKSFAVDRATVAEMKLTLKEITHN